MSGSGWSSASRWVLGVLAGGLLCGGIVSAQPAGFRSQVFLSDGSAFNDPNSAAGFQDLRAQGPATRTEMGSSVVFGNFNGDAFQDVAIGVRKSNQVLVYFGRLVLDPNDSSLGASGAFVIEPGLAAGSGGPDLVITCPSCQTGSNNSDFGFSLAAGDVNVDGRHDLIIGAPFDDDGAANSDRGRAFIVLGRASWSATVSVDGDVQTYKLTTGGTNGNGYFLGFAVAAGDFDGDGRADVAVSSRNADRRSTGGIFDPNSNLPDTGAVHLFRASGLPAPPATIAANGAGIVSIAGEKGSDFLGEHMVFCNVDNDLDSGFPSMDLLVGAIGVDNPENVQLVTNAGAMYVFRGQTLKGLTGGPANATTPSTSAASSIYGAEKDDSLGFSVACGDIDGDGFDDPATGAFFAGANINRRGGGEVYVFYGGAPLGTAAFPAERNLRRESVGPPAEPDFHPDDSDLVIFPATGSDQLGFGLSMGDLDGDGLLDVVTSARRYDADANSVDGGITYAIRGSSTRPREFIIDLLKGTVFDPNVPNDRPDYPIAHSDNPGPTAVCNVASPNDPADPCAVMAILMGRVANSQSGFSVAAGDFNGDGFDEVMVGAIGNPTNLTTYGGRAYVASFTDVDTDGVSDLSDEDNDNDCLADADEPTNGTDRLDQDTDHDGLQDGTELGVQSVSLRGEFVSPACPANAGAPCCRLDQSPSSTSDPLDPDTDDDCIPDGCISTGAFPNAGPCPPVNPPGPNLQGEDVDLDGARGSTEPDATLLDTDGDGLPDGLEWGVTAAACTFLGTNPTSPQLKTDLDPVTTTNPGADDTDGGGALDGDEDVNLDGRRDFDPSSFTCGANPSLDVNNETDPVDRNDDRGADFSRSPSPDFADPNNQVVTAYLQNEMAEVLLTDTDENKDPAVAETITLLRTLTLNPSSPLVFQGLTCLPDDPALTTNIDNESITLTETGPNTGMFLGILPVSTSPGSPGSGTLNCNEDGRIRVAYRDDDDLCDQRTNLADTTLSQIETLSPPDPSAPVTSALTTVAAVLDQEIACASATGAVTIVSTTSAPSAVPGGTFACAPAGFHRTQLTFTYGSALADDRYTVTLDCDTPAPSLTDVRGFRADCERPCVQPVTGPPGYCTGSLSGDGTEGGAYSYAFAVDNDSSPTATPAGPNANQILTTTPATVAVQFSEAMDPATITVASMTVQTTMGGVTCSSVVYDAALHRATCALSGLATPPDDRYTVTLTGTGGAPVRDLAGNALDGDANGAAGGNLVYTFTVDTDSSPPVTAAAPAPSSVATLAVTQVTATFNEAMNGSTVTSSTFTVVGTMAAVTPSSVTYAPATKSASFNVASLQDDRYTVTLVGTGGAPIRDFAANALDGEFSGSFPSGDGVAGGDFTYTFVADNDNSPSASAFDPNANQTVTVGSTSVTVVFSESMDPSTITTSTFTVVGTMGPAPCTGVTYTPSNRGATCTVAALTDDQYTVTIASTVKDLAGNALDGNGDGITGDDLVYTFTVDTDSSPTGTPFDPNANQVLTVAPASVVVQFSEPMNAATVTTTTMLVQTTVGGVSCSSVVYDAALKRATCALGGLASPPDDRYTVTLLGTGGAPVRDLAGNSLDGDANGTAGGNLVYTFTVDTDPLPAATAVSPANASTYTLPAPLTAVTVDFSEAMNAATLTAASFLITGTAGAVAPTSVTYTGATKRATFNLSGGLPDDTYTVTLKGTGGAQVADFNGNALDGEFPCTGCSAPKITGNGTAGGDFVFTFLVDRDTSPSVIATSTGCDPNVIVAASPATVTIDFSEAMNGTRFDPTTVSLVDDGDPNIVFNTLGGSVTYNASTRRASLTPDAPLGNGVYRLIVKGTTSGTDVVDLNGNLLDGEFTTTFPSGNGAAGGDFVCRFAIQVSGTFIRIDDVDPPMNDRRTSPNFPGDRAKIRVTERPLTASVTANSFRVTGTDSVNVCTSYTFANAGPITNGNILCNVPVTMPDDRYTVTARGDVLDPNARIKAFTNSNSNFLDGECKVGACNSNMQDLPTGNSAPGGDMVYFFVLDDDNRPQVTAMTPTPASTLVAPITTVSVTFDQRMDPNTINTSTFTVTGTATGAASGTVSWNAGTRTATFTAASPLPDDAFTVRLDSDGVGTDVSDFRDLATGNRLDGDCTGGTCESGELPSGDGTAGEDFVAVFTVAVPARVQSMTPVPSSSNVGRLTQIVWTFDQAMDATTLIAGNVSIVGGTVGAQSCDSLTPSVGNTVLTCTKTAGFPEDAAYAVTLASGGIKDADGSNLDGDFPCTSGCTGVISGNGTAGGNFVVTFALDTLPAVSSMTPTPSTETGSAPTSVDVVFTEAMDGTTITATTFTISGSAGTVTADSVTYNSGTRTATFALAGGFPDDVYTVTLNASSTGIKDDDGRRLDGEFLCTGCIGTAISGNGTEGGNFVASFTVDADAVPSVTSMSPAAASTATSAVTSVSTAFDQEMDPATIMSSTFTVVGALGGAVTPDSVTYVASTSTATFARAAGLPDDSYTVTLDSDGAGTDVRDFGVPSGNRLDGECTGGTCETGELPSGNGTAGGSYVATFTVDADQLPQVVSTSPSPGSTVTSSLTSITVTFDQIMNASTIDSTNFTLVGAGAGAITPDSVTFDVPTRSATFTVAAGLADDIYTVTLDASGSGVKDAAGNRLDGEFPCTSGCTGVISGDGTVGGNFTVTFTLDAVPGIQPIDPSIELTSTGVISWTPPPAPPGGGQTVYNLYRGILENLTAGGAYTQDPSQVFGAMAACGITGTTYDDQYVPTRGRAMFYLMAVVENGVEGGLGTDSTGAQRPSAGLCDGGTVFQSGADDFRSGVRGDNRSGSRGE